MNTNSREQQHYRQHHDLPSVEQMWTDIQLKYRIDRILMHKPREPPTPGARSATTRPSLIYAAIEHSNDRDVALKVIPVDNAQERYGGRHEAELHAMTTGSKNIVELIEAYESRTEIVLVMERCLAGSLLDRLNQQGPFDEMEARHLYRQLIDALVHCYQRGVCHRDVKLENILLQSSAACFCGEDVGHGEDIWTEVLKLCDFGLSEAYTPESRYRTPCGSLEYVAPEILRASSDPRIPGYDAELSDVWSASVVLYALVTGQLPFGTALQNKSLTISMIRSGTYYALPERISPELASFLKQTLNINAAERPTLEQIQQHPWYTGNGLPVGTLARRHSGQQGKPSRRQCYSRACPCGAFAMRKSI